MSKCEWYQQSSRPNLFGLFGENCDRYWYDNKVEKTKAQDLKKCPFCGEEIEFDMNNEEEG